MSEVIWSEALRKPIAAAEVLARWRAGQNTREIAFDLFLVTGRDLDRVEGRVCRMIAAEQDRRYAERSAARCA